MNESFLESEKMPITSRALIEVANTAANLTPSPIKPSWIIEGNPVAEASLLAQSADGQACTLVWQCSEGRFNWNYDYDETILILEGSIVLENDAMPPTRYGPGDVIFFRDGAHARWHVESRVRKLAFCRKTKPILLTFASRAFSKIKRSLMPARKHKADRRMT
jgi:uncharacterized cupin superfamily protein